MNGKRVMITGGLGFIGSNLAHRLVEMGAIVSIIDNLHPNGGGSLHNIDGIRDRVTIGRRNPTLGQACPNQDVVFNLAGLSSHMDSMEYPLDDAQNNVMAQIELLEGARRYNPGVKIVYASTRQVYGKPDYLHVNETHPVRPVDVNGINKWTAEEYHRLYHEVYGLRTCSLRLTNTIGPRMRIKDAKQGFIGEWIRRVLTGEPFEVWGGEQVRDFTYVDDAVEAFILAAQCDESDGQAYNLGARMPYKLIEVAGMLCDVAGQGSYVVKSFPTDRKRIDIGSYWADYSKANEDLSWNPTVELCEALRLTLDYYRCRLEHYT